MNKTLTISLIVHVIIATILIFSLWRKNDSIFIKLLWSLFILVPIIGPVFYLAFFKLPPPNKHKSKITNEEAIQHALAAEHFNDR